MWIVLRNAAAVVILAAAVTGAIGSLVRLPPVRWVWRRLIGEPISSWGRSIVREVVSESTESLAAHQTEMGDRLKRVEDRTVELQSNGGSSMRDQITRIESMMFGHLEEEAIDRGDLWEVLAKQGIHDRRHPKPPEEPKEHQ